MTKKIPPYSEINDEGRRFLKRKVLNHLHRSGMIKALDTKDSSGARPIIVAFEDETVGAVIEQASWSGGSANVVVLMEHEYRIAVMALTAGTQTPSYSKARASHLSLQPDSHIGMFVHAAEHSAEPLALAFGGAPDTRFAKPEFIKFDELAGV